MYAKMFYRQIRLQVRFWDLATQTAQAECRGHKNWVLCLAWSPDAKYVASGDMDGDLWLWDPTTGKAFGACRGHRKWITSIVSQSMPVTCALAFFRLDLCWSYEEGGGCKWIIVSVVGLCSSSKDT